MSLVADNELIEVGDPNFVATRAAIEKWQHCSASALLHHGRLCCRIAREWLFSTDYAQLNGAHPLTGPRWLRQKYTWGPSAWPLSWCAAVEQKTLDCGALAAIAHEVFTMRGVTSYPAQFIQQYSADSTRHWRQKWATAECPAHWIDEELIYHEGCAVMVRDNEIRLWDSSAGWWVNPKQFGGYGGVLALRVCAAHADAANFRWGAQRIAANQWQQIDRMRAGLN
jgi:hypothetical protein